MPDTTPNPPFEPTAPGGLVHTYLAYDPKHFPSPLAPPPNLAGAAFEHMLAFGSMSEFTDEQIANAIHLDPSMFSRMGPSLDSLMAMLRERRAKILATHETEAAKKQARSQVREQKSQIEPPREHKDEFRRAADREQIRDLERLWDKQKDEQSEFSLGILNLMERLGEQYQIDALASKYDFTGRTPMDVPKALEIKEELETIDRLLDQLKTAAQNAQLAVIDMEALSEFAQDGEMENLNALQQQVQDYLREEAARQGLEQSSRGYSLSPQAYRLFQRKLLAEIFSELEAARSGRHRGPIAGEGPVELQRTKPYEFGDPVAGLDIVQSIANAASRATDLVGAETKSVPENQGLETNAGTLAPKTTDFSKQRSVARSISVTIDDLEIHRTRNSPRCATAVLLDMSGSMRQGAQYVNCKRMALALDGLIRTEYPGDFLAFFEMYTLAKRRPVNELPALMPKPVTIFQSQVRLRADLSNPDVSELRLPQHFTNIQHALRLARQTLAVQDTPNRQVILITDGLPTAHFEGPHLYMLYPPDPQTEEATMREAMLCAREGITINIFLLPNWNQSHEDVQFAQRLAETTRGRVFFTGGKDLDRFVLWDYVSQRRKIIG